jgi:hypothetical protein
VSKLQYIHITINLLYICIAIYPFKKWEIDCWGDTYTNSNIYVWGLYLGPLTIALKIPLLFKRHLNKG